MHIIIVIINNEKRRRQSLMQKLFVVVSAAAAVVNLTCERGLLTLFLCVILHFFLCRGQESARKRFIESFCCYAERRYLLWYMYV